MKRLGFLAGTGSVLCGALGAPAAAKPDTVKMSFTFDEIKQIAETLRQTGTTRIWRPPSAFPKFAPLAFFQGHTTVDGKAAVVIWINVDHRELMTPRASHPEDEEPIVAAMIVGESDKHVDVPAWKHLYDAISNLSVQMGFDVATGIAMAIRQVAPVVTAPHVSDADFAAEAFPFAVIRNMTPGVDGVEADNAPAGTAMPKDAPLIAYVGRTDPRHAGKPVVWGDPQTPPAQFFQRPDFLELYMRTYILATADMQPPSSPEKLAYDQARALDERAGAGVYAARFAFAEPYLPRVRALAPH